MEITAAMLLTVCPLIFLASLVDSIGGGGGLISLPAYLVAGLDAQWASGTNKFSACFGTLLATIRFGRGGKIHYKPALAAALSALPASYLGAWVQQQLTEATVRGFMLVAIPIVAVLLLVKRDAPAASKPITPRVVAGCFFIGMGCGFYDGFFGPGTGTILIMLFTWVAGMDMVSASGCAKVVNLASNVAALGSFLQGGYVLLPLAIPATCCSLLGGYIGASLALKKGAKLIRYIMMGVLAALIVRLVLEYFGVIKL